MGGTPRFIARGEGAHIFDVDGNEYIDYIGSWGPLLLGHRYPAVLDAIEQGYRRICLTAPTGAGKTRIMCELIDRWTGEEPWTFCERKSEGAAASPAV